MCGNSERKVKSESHSVMSNSLRPHGLYPARILCPWNSPGLDTTVGSCFLLQGTFPIQGSNPGLSHCRWILYHLSHQESPRKQLFFFFFFLVRSLLFCFYQNHPVIFHLSQSENQKTRVLPGFSKLCPIWQFFDFIT